MTRLLGCDFSSSPSKRKQIAIAWGEAAGERVLLKQLQFFLQYKISANVCTHLALG